MPKKSNKARGSTVAALVLAVIVMSSAHGQQPYPSKPVTIILPYAPGGSTSTLAYLIRQKLTEGWGQRIRIEIITDGVRVQ